MASPRRRIRYLDAVLAVFLFATLLFATPVIYLWTGPGSAWYTPYLLWLFVILLAGWAWQQRTQRE